MSTAKQITIFGGTGFVGRYLIDRLCDLGFTVRVATRRPSGVYFLRTAGFVGQVVPVPCDIFNDDHLRMAIGDSSHVVNLVGIIAEKRKNNFTNVHTDFPARLARIAAEQGVERFVHISALGADENAISHYAQSKARGEQAVLSAFPQASILRPSIIFGPEDNFFNRFAQLASLSPALPLIGGGKTKFQPVYVGDVANAIIQCLTKTEGVQGQTFELAGDDVYSFRDLMDKILTETKHKRRLVPVPFALAKLKGAVLQYLPGQLLTVDQVRSLKVNNVATGKPGLNALGISPTPLDAVLPTYLNRFRPGGRFARAQSKSA